MRECREGDRRGWLTLSCPTLVLPQWRCVQKQHKRTVHDQVLLMVQGSAGKLRRLLPVKYHQCMQPPIPFSFGSLGQLFPFANSSQVCVLTAILGVYALALLTNELTWISSDFTKRRVSLAPRKSRRPCLLRVHQGTSGQSHCFTDAFILPSTFHYKRDVIAIEKIWKTL